MGIKVVSIWLYRGRWRPENVVMVGGSDARSSANGGASSNETTSMLKTLQNLHNDDDLNDFII
jgi:hypothetical protein